MAAPNSSDKPPFPIVTAAQIDAARSERRHWLNMSAVRRNVCISDMGAYRLGYLNGAQECRRRAA